MNLKARVKAGDVAGQTDAAAREAVLGYLDDDAVVRLMRWAREGAVSDGSNACVGLTEKEFDRACVDPAIKARIDQIGQEGISVGVSGNGPKLTFTLQLDPRASA